METIILASGSKGNATLIRSGTTTVLLDAGISYKAMRERLGGEADLAGIEGVLLTHPHNDHVRGLKGVMNRIRAPLYTTAKTFHSIQHKHSLSPPFFEVDPNRPFTLGDLYITPISLSHDTEDTLGFRIDSEGRTLAYITDTGFLPEKDFDNLRNLDMYIFESNYDVATLFSSQRPYYLKRRIDSIKGHLSNADAAYYLSRLVGPKTRRIVLAHPSEECNTEAQALKTLNSVFQSYERSLEACDVVVAKQHEAVGWYEI